MNRILVMTNGWVLVGKFDADKQLLEDAKTIRRWGTSRGLGELKNGPLAQTKLDPLGDIAINNVQVLFSLEVGGKW